MGGAPSLAEQSKPRAAVPFSRRGAEPASSGLGARRPRSCRPGRREGLAKSGGGRGSPASGAPVSSSPPHSSSPPPRPISAAAPRPRSAFGSGATQPGCHCPHPGVRPPPCVRPPLAPTAARQSEHDRMDPSSSSTAARHGRDDRRGPASSAAPASALSPGGGEPVLLRDGGEVGVGAARRRWWRTRGRGRGLVCYSAREQLGGGAVSATHGGGGGEPGCGGEGRDCSATARSEVGERLVAASLGAGGRGGERSPRTAAEAMHQRREGTHF